MPWRSTIATDEETPPAVARTAGAAFAPTVAAAVESRSGRERSDIVPFVAAKGDRSERTPSWGRRPYHRHECPEVTKPTSVPANWAPTTRRRYRGRRSGGRVSAVYVRTESRAGCRRIGAATCPPFPSVASASSGV